VLFTVMVAAYTFAASAALLHIPIDIARCNHFMVMPLLD
jgi:hypothetical protein